MSDKTPLKSLPDETLNALMIHFFTAQRKSLDGAGIKVVDDDSAIARLVEIVFWKAYSMGAADATRIMDNTTPELAIKQAEDHIAKLTMDMRVQSFMDDVAIYESGGDDGSD